MRGIPPINSLEIQMVFLVWVIIQDFWWLKIMFKLHSTTDHTISNQKYLMAQKFGIKIELEVRSRIINFTKILMKILNSPLVDWNINIDFQSSFLEIAISEDSGQLLSPSNTHSAWSWQAWFKLSAWTFGQWKIPFNRMTDKTRSKFLPIYRW